MGKYSTPRRLRTVSPLEREVLWRRGFLNSEREEWGPEDWNVVMKKRLWPKSSINQRNGQVHFT